MLLQLKIKNYLLIEQLDIDFYSGLTVITGETGSGKSIIIDALMLIFGARVTRDVVRQGTQNANFEAIFTTNNPLTKSWLQENDLLDTDNPESIICRRIIDNQGKSKSQINGYNVTLSQIRSLGDYLIDIHTQHASITLLKPDAQRKLLDEFCGISDQVTKLSNIYKQIQDLEEKLNNAMSAARELELKREILNEKISELGELNLNQGEWEDLNSEHKQLNNAEEVLKELDYSLGLLTDSEQPLVSGVRELHSRLSKIINYVPKLDDTLKIVDSIEIELRELSHEINTLANNINQDPERLTQVEERMDKIFSLSRKYRIEPDQIPVVLNEMQTQLAMLDEDSNIAKIEEQLSLAKAEYSDLAKIISKSRTSASNKLSKMATELLHKMAITGEFKINLQPVNKPMSFGLENIEYQVCFNKGMLLQPLANAASGGELSRVALALYLLLSIHNPPEIIIFDEIDVGVGGKVASVVGQMLLDLGANKQVICITHQPQAASCGHNHLVVAKTQNKTSTLTEVNYVKDKDRIAEVARMLGGVQITETTINHAKEMLNQHSTIK